VAPRAPDDVTRERAAEVLRGATAGARRVRRQLRERFSGSAQAFGASAAKSGWLQELLYNCRDNPAPGVGQPEDLFSTLDKRGGRFSTAKPKTYIEQHVYDKKEVPTPGRGQPDGGFSTIDRRGGRFNESKPKTYIEQHVYDKKEVPTPGRGQPDGGFSTMYQSSYNAVNRLQQSVVPMVGGCDPTRTD